MLTLCRFVCVLVCGVWVLGWGEGMVGVGGWGGCGLRCGVWVEVWGVEGLVVVVGM